MKTTKLTLIIITFFSFTLLSQTPEQKREDNKGSFVEYQFNPTDLNNWNNFFNEKEEIKERTIPVFISTNYVNKVLENKNEVLDISLPLSNNIELTLEKKDINYDGLQLIVRTEEGNIPQQYNPGFVTYQVNNDEVNGIMIFSKSGLAQYLNMIILHMS